MRGACAIIPPDEFEPFDAERYTELCDVPSSSGQYLRRMLAARNRPLMFVTIPHVLVARPIALSGAQDIDPAEPPDWGGRMAGGR